MTFTGRATVGLAWLAMVGALAVLASHPADNCDVIWYLVAGRQLERTAAAYVELRDLNLPLIWQLNALAADLGAALGLPPHRAFFGLAALWLALMLLATQRLLRQCLPLGGSPLFWPLLALLAWLFAAAPALQAGQRDHLAAIGLLPYLALAGLRAGGGRADRLAVALTGLGLAVALGLKPFYLLVPLLLEGAWAWRQRRLRPLDERVLGWALAAGALLLLAGWPLYPAFLANVEAQGGLYRWLPSMPLDQPRLLLFGALALALVAAVALRRAPAASPLPAWLLGSLAALAAALAQGTLWNYHLLPTALFLASGLAVAGAGWLAARRLPRPRFAAALVLLLALALTATGALSAWRYARSSGGYGYNASVVALHSFFQAQPPGGVAVLSDDWYDVLPAVYLAGRAWTLAEPTLWQATAFARARQAAVAQGDPTAAAALDQAEAAFKAAVVARLAADPPMLLGLLLPGGSSGLDPLRYFAGVPGFAALLARYQPLGDVAGHRFLLRR